MQEEVLFLPSILFDGGCFIAFLTFGSSASLCLAGGSISCHPLFTLILPFERKRIGVVAVWKLNTPLGGTSDQVSDIE